MLARLDERLVALARQAGALRLRLGQLLEVLGDDWQGGGSAHAELGFLRFSAYVHERCQLGVRSAQVARAVARRLEGLPLLRRAVARSELGWSQAELLSELANPARESEPLDEAEWLSVARRMTVRQLRAVAHLHAADAPATGDAAGDDAGDDAAGDAAGDDAAGDDAAGDDAGDVGAGDVGDEPVELRLRVDREDLWLWEATRALLGLRLGTPMTRDQGFALLAEAHTSLSAEHPELDLDLGGAEWREPGAAEWRAQRAAWLAVAEARCEAALPREPFVGLDGELAAVDGELAAAVTAGLAALRGINPIALDAAVCEVARELAGRDLELGQGLLALHRADGWRALGYASEQQYARERLGISRSLLHARRALALRLERLPVITAALRGGQVGVEAAVELVRVATPLTEAAWADRARRRTLKLLREETAAASVARRVSGEVDCPPPTDRELDEYFALERAVVTGAVVTGAVVTGAVVTGAVVTGAVVTGGSGTGGSGTGGSGTGGSGTGGSGAAMGHGGRGAGATAVQMSAQSDHAGDAARATAVQMSARSSTASAAAGPFRTALASLASWLAGGLEGTAAPRRLGARLRGAGRASVVLRLSRADYDYWHLLERAWRRATYSPMSFLRYACLCVWDAWRHVLRDDASNGNAVLGRDRGRCTCPVCDALAESRHHLVFRSRGGSDDDDNLTSLCPLCHLDGIHAGRLAAEGEAGNIAWTIGRAPVMRVVGRERLQA